MTSTNGAFVEFWSIAGRVEIIGLASSSSMIQVTVDDESPEMLTLVATDDASEPRVLWAKDFETDSLRVLRVTNLDGKMELDYIRETALEARNPTDSDEDLQGTGEGILQVQV